MRNRTKIGKAERNDTMGKQASSFHPIFIYWDIRGLRRIEVESFMLIGRSRLYDAAP